MKDELDGQIIDKAYFLGIKKYGFIAGSKSKSVIAGIEKNSVSFQEIEQIFGGTIISKVNPNRFFKSLSKLSIIIKASTTSVNFINDKKLVNNKYLPIKVHAVKNFNTKYTLAIKIFNRILKLIKQTFTPFHGRN
jgi:hypothetical protein